MPTHGSPVAGLLLTGGRSLRLGTPKAALVTADGSTLAARTARLLGEATAPAFDVGGQGGAGLPVVADEREGDGPLAALASGWEALVGAGFAGDVIVVATDLPLLRRAVLYELRDHPAATTVVPMVNGRRQVLCARYAGPVAGRARAMVDAGERSMRSLLDGADVVELADDHWRARGLLACFADVDTPDDLASFRAVGAIRAAGF